MLNLLYRSNIHALTAELLVRFCKPAYVGEKLFLTSQIQEKRNKFIQTSAEAKNSLGQVVAKAQGKCIIIRS